MRPSTGRWRQLPISSPTAADVWETLADEACRESALWAESLRPPAERECQPVFSPLAAPRLALGLETIYEGYLVHYGRSRLFEPTERNTVLLLGDYLYAHGLVRVAASASAAAVADLAELISLCAQLQGSAAGTRPVADGPLWAATAALLGTRALDEARAALRDAGEITPLAALADRAAGHAAVARALAAHALRVGG